MLLARGSKKPAQAARKGAARAVFHGMKKSVLWQKI